MDKAKLFTIGENQFVQIPKYYAFEGDEMYIKKVRDAIVLTSKKATWQSLIDSLDKFSEDFMEERCQPEL
ncbi:MAG: type II toxin-antitoxin system VapB family antitoxin [bacterium]